MATSIKTKEEHFVHGSRFLVNPGGNSKEFLIGISAKASKEELQGMKECFYYNSDWFKTVRVGFGEENNVKNQQS